MSYNGSGTFNINTAGQPVVTGTTITSTAFNLLTTDLATGLTTALTKDGQTTPTANIPMGTFKITGLGAGSAATDAAQYGQLQANATTIATVSGTDTLTGSLTPALAAYATGNLFSFVAVATNTGATTINLNSLGAKSITKSGTTALAAGDLVSGQVYLIEYDGTRFQLINPSSVSGVSSISFGSTGLTPSTTTSGAVTVAGTLAIANGGTGTTSTTFANLTTNVTGTLPIANGGTNSTATPTAGGVVYGTGSAQAVTTAGTSGYFLKSNGASAPSWVAASSGALTFLSSVTASSSSTVDIETTIDSTYGSYLLVVTGLRPSIDGAKLLCRFKVAGSYYAADYYFVGVTTNSGATTYSSVTNGGVAGIEFGSLLGKDPGRNMNFNFSIFNPSSTTLYKLVRWDGAGFGSGGYLDNFQGFGGMYNTDAFNGVRFYTSSGTIATGTFRLYGIANS